jgi:hypothetical protein
MVCSAQSRHDEQASSQTPVAARGSLADALKQAAFFAAPGSSYCPDTLAKLQQMEAAAGGRFHFIPVESTQCSTPRQASQHGLSCK